MQHLNTAARLPAPLTIAVLGSLLILGLVGADVVSAQPLATAVPNYADAKSWLCRPGVTDVCNVDLTATIVAPDGTLTREPWVADPSAAVDCFYVYPTVSTDPPPYSDMTPGDAERTVVRQQFARFGSKCRLFAPVYRQVTLSGVASTPLDRGTGYDDVRAAWQHYLAHDNKGRGFVLVGHSQGATVLTQLLRSEIDGKPIQSQLVSAILAGTLPAVDVPRGKDVGGTFKSVPLCRTPSQTGCLIVYASYRSTATPVVTSPFGRVMNPAMVAACTNPAALGGGSGQLDAYLDSTGQVMLTPSTPSAPAKPWVSSGPRVATPYVSVPGLLTASCASNAFASYLQVQVNGNPSDPRVDDINGDFKQRDWGLHLVDLHLALGNLIDIVGQQAKAYVAKGGSTK
jgi:hypothetical protein